MEIAVLVSAGALLAVLGAVLGVILGRYVWPAAALIAAQMEVARLSERAIGVTRQLEEQVKLVSSLEAQRQGAETEAKTAAAEVARLNERESALSEKIAEQAAQLADLQNSSLPSSKILRTGFSKRMHRSYRIPRKRPWLPCLIRCASEFRIFRKKWKPRMKLKPAR